MFGAFGSRPALVSAQDEEVISDPELSGGSARGGGRASSGDEVIADPELSGGGAKPAKKDYGWGEVYKPKTSEQEEQAAEPAAAAPPPEEPDPMANTGIAKLELSGQTAVDTHAEGNMEDFYEARLRFGGEVDFRISRRLRLSIGTRIDFAWYAPFQGDKDLLEPKLDADGQELKDPNNPQRTLQYRRSMFDEDRFEVDIIPLSAYVDATLADGVHLRVGEQVISLARMDGLSMTDMLAVVDFRPQTKMDPAGLKLAQPAVRLDWDFNSWATLQLLYVPWFMPHLMRPNRDNYVGQAVGAVHSSGIPPPSVSKLIDPSFQTKGQEDVLRFVGPAPDFSTPQAEARLNLRGSSFEIAILGGTALEKLPSIYYTPRINSLLTAGFQTDDSAFNTELSDAAAQMAAGYRLIDVVYHRYYLLGLDGSFDIAPVQVSFEFAYSPSRHLYATDSTGRALPAPDVSKQIADPDDSRWMEAPNSMANAKACKSAIVGCASDARIRRGAQMVQAALHIEYLKGETLLLAAEGYLYQALALPHSRDRQWLGFPKGTGTYAAGLLAGSYNLQEGKYRFDLSALITMGPSFMITPQIEFQLADTFFLNVGAQFYEGPTPNNLKKDADRKIATNLTLGGVLSGYDNVYLGFRWTP